MTEIKSVSKMDASVAVVGVIDCECFEYSQFNLGSITVFLDCPNDLDSTSLSLLSIIRFDNLSKSSLAKETHNVIYNELADMNTVELEIPKTYICP